eukprot:4668590-Prymnesium_polylepis.1
MRMPWAPSGCVRVRVREPVSRVCGAGYGAHLGDLGMLRRQQRGGWALSLVPACAQARACRAA